MAYRNSQIDKDNFSWFTNDYSVNTMIGLSVRTGQLRCLKPVDIRFRYPITAIAGENGSGKSTVLALASCAFHNESLFCPQNRYGKNPNKPRHYYTYSDFFTFTPQEKGFPDITISTEYLGDPILRIPKTVVRKKKAGGKWNDYSRRPKRVVSYMGIHRIVPPSESNPHKHYSNYFIKGKLTNEQQEQLTNSMTAILGRKYSDIEQNHYNGYRLFGATRGSLTYTGFNMGAGENAILGLLLEIISAGNGSLIVIDEIELGLHTQAQVRLIKELKKLCKKYHCQIICSTHSPEVLRSLPPEGRIFLEQSAENTNVLYDISPEYSFSKLSGTKHTELTLLVEDEVGEAFVSEILPMNLRERIVVKPVGSDQTVLKHMAVHYREGDLSFAAFLDGDKHTQKLSAISRVIDHLESRLPEARDSFTEKMNLRLNYLPGDEWPERVLIENALEKGCLDSLSESWGCTTDEVTNILEESLAAEKHSEFYTISQKVCKSIEAVRIDVIRLYKKNNPEIIHEIVDSVKAVINT